MTAKPLSPDQVLDKMAKYCAYQERCLKDVVDKMKAFDLNEDDKKEILNYLIDNRFVDNERFARSFVRGKVNQSGWGVNKIRFHLLQKGIEKSIIDEALQGLDDENYRQRLCDILKSKLKTVKAENDFEKRRKLAAYAIQKGFEPNLVFTLVKEIIP
ncbi:MAG: RecX family transcriptional regulator [Bacteroidales bacterium]|nr:RecX family transcriptional regulator [Bacteroidales bacterium]